MAKPDWLNDPRALDDWREQHTVELRMEMLRQLTYTELQQFVHEYCQLEFKRLAEVRRKERGLP